QQDLEPNFTQRPACTETDATSPAASRPDHRLRKSCKSRFVDRPPARTPPWRGRNLAGIEALPGVERRGPGEAFEQLPLLGGESLRHDDLHFRVEVTGPAVRVPGELLVLGVTVAACTGWEIGHEAGTAPAPDRACSTWPDFLHSPAEGFLACNFIEIVTSAGTRPYLLAVIAHSWTVSAPWPLRRRLRSHPRTARHRPLTGYGGAGPLPA